ncbi:hypothetical protein GQX73_g4521 [Xylaria multiplex]|uniref:Uncharacterized protein n=1 Tax=Xylaria multiplex TaxID=323545 RepID=A0A7C8MMT3_9PEZI|nr:hypothetical protein GQX73_g4521 [Xylaria multiplex]
MEQRFPNRSFPWGGDINVSPDENKKLIQNMKEKGLHYERPSRWFTYNEKEGKQRTVYPKNALGADETILQTIVDSEEFWMAVISLAPPRLFMDTTKVIEHLSKTCPMEKPSNTRAWRKFQPWLVEVIRQGNLGGWSDKMALETSPIEPELVEAIRIIGDTERGLGVFPKRLKDQMENAACQWILVKPSDRIIPSFWKKHFEDNRIEYKACIPAASTKFSEESKDQSLKPKRRIANDLLTGTGYVDMSDKVYEISSDTQDEQDTDDEISYNGGFLTGRASSERTITHKSNRPDTKNPIGQGGKQSTTDGDYVKVTQEMLEELNHIKERGRWPTPQDPSPVVLQTPEDPYSIVSIEKTRRMNEEALRDNQMEVYDNLIGQTEAFVSNTLRNAMINGVIHTQIQQITSDAFQAAQIANDAQWNKKVKATIKPETEAIQVLMQEVADLKQKVQEMKGQKKRYKTRGQQTDPMLETPAKPATRAFRLSEAQETLPMDAAGQKHNKGQADNQERADKQQQEVDNTEDLEDPLPQRPRDMKRRKFGAWFA